MMTHTVLNLEPGIETILCILSLLYPSALPLGCKAASDAAFPPQSQSNKGIIKGKESKQSDNLS